MLKTTPGEVRDCNIILTRLAWLNADYDIREVAFDSLGAAKLLADIENPGLTLVQFGQGFGSMSAPMKELERLIVDRQAWGHPVLDWMDENVVARFDPAGNIKPEKEKSAGKISGIVALIMGLDKSICWRKTQPVYATRNLQVITF